MRDSRVRTRRFDRRVASALALGSFVALAFLGLAMLTGHALASCRALVCALGLFAGVSQGALLLAATMYFCAPDFRPALRRVAEILGLAIPAVPIAHIARALILLPLVRGADRGFADRSSALALSIVLSLSGIVYIAAVVAPDIAAAFESGEADGSLARFVARIAPQRALRIARWSAASYVVIYAFAAPWIANTAVVSVRAPARAGIWIGPYLALSDAFSAVVAIALVVALLASAPAFRDDLSSSDLRFVARSIAWCSLVLGSSFAIQLVAAFARSPRVDLAVLPTGLGWRGWRTLAIVAFVLAYVTPCCVLGVRRLKASAGIIAVSATGAMAGVWFERCAISAPTRAPGFAWVEVFALLALASAFASLIVRALAVAGLDATVESASSWRSDLDRRAESGPYPAD
jgi:hypothetical protein